LFGLASIAIGSFADRLANTFRKPQATSGERPHGQSRQLMTNGDGPDKATTGENPHKSREIYLAGRSFQKPAARSH
jgi:hypothetical protein